MRPILEEVPSAHKLKKVQCECDVGLSCGKPQCEDNNVGKSEILYMKTT